MNSKPIQYKRWLLEHGLNVENYHCEGRIDCHKPAQLIYLKRPNGRYMLTEILALHTPTVSSCSENELPTWS
jgi:hypothetical protein